MRKRNMVISLVGRPNVGKSSIFNRILKKSHKAITFDLPGVTRDRHYAIARFDDVGNLPETDAILVDTGGFYPEKVDFEANTKKQKDFNVFFSIMASQSELAIKESDLVLFVVDVREGPLPFDKAIIDFIRKERKEVWVIANKFDSEKQRGSELEFFDLGINPDNLMTVSAAHGPGMTLLRERLHRKAISFNKQLAGEDQLNGELQRGVTPDSSVVASLAIIGAPNAGKSTLLNRLLGAERALVSDIAGTTVDPIEGYTDIFFGEDVKHLNHQENEFTTAEENQSTLYQDYLAYVEQYGDDEDDGDEKKLLDYDFFTNEEPQLIDYDQINEFEQELNAEELNEMEEKIFADESEQESNEDEAETTPVQTEATSFWRSVKIVDTAGIRRQKSVEEGIEALSVYRALRAITESDVVLVMVDATKGLTHQDRRLCDIALDKGKSIIVVLNKMDLMKSTLKTPSMKKEWLADLRASIPWLDFCDIITISAKFGDAIRPLKESIAKSIIVRHKKVPTGALNRTVKNLIEKNSIILRGSNGKIFRAKYVAMVKSGPPTFLLFCNKAQEIPETYIRYLKNGIRREFKLKNAPIHLIFRASTQLQKARKSEEAEQVTTN